MGVLTLLIAIVNYVNLANDRVDLRACEVAVRKVLGGTRASLIRHFVGEAIATTAIAALVGLALAEIALPFVNSVGGLDLSIDHWGAHSILPPLLLLVALIRVLAGAYPAFVLSQYRPAAVLALARAGRWPRRRAPAAGIGDFPVRHRDRLHHRYRRAGRADAAPSLGRSRLWPRRHHHRAFTGVARGDSAPGDNGTTNSNTVSLPGEAAGPKPSLTLVNVGLNYFNVYGARLLAGRLFDTAHAFDDRTDSTKADLLAAPHSAIVNLSAVKQLGFVNPEAAIAS